MHRITTLFTALAATVISLSACGSSGSVASALTGSFSAAKTRAVVIVSGVAAITPFTTPTAACKNGYAAGNSDTYLREVLLNKGYAVYTSPAMAGPGPVTDQAGEGGPFDTCPVALPAEMTVNAVGSVIVGGKSLANFIVYLNKTYGITEVDLVAHSLGGLFSREGVAELQRRNSPVKVKSLTTVGSPWESPMLARPTDPKDPLSACDGLKICAGILKALLSIPSTSVIIDFFQLDAFKTWTNAQAGVLNDIPVTLIGGTYFNQGKDPEKWPNDGLIQIKAAMATTIPDAVLPLRSCFKWNNAHSIFISKLVNLPNEQALTWNPEVAQVVANAISSADTAMTQPNRVGCPAAF